MLFARRHLAAWFALLLLVSALAPSRALAQTDEVTPPPSDTGDPGPDAGDNGTDPGPVDPDEGDGGPDAEDPVDEEPEPPPPPQVPLAGLRNGPDAPLDGDLQAALFAVDLIETWHALTPTIPELSLVAVDGAEETRAQLLDAVDAIITARETTAGLLKASLDAAAERRSLESDRDELVTERDNLVTEREAAEAHKTRLVEDHTSLGDAVEQAAVGLYVAEESVTVDLDDVVAYNDSANRSVIVDAALDDLLARRDDLAAQIVEATAGIEALGIRIDDTVAAIAATDDDIANRVETIETLAARIDDQVRQRTDIEDQLPDMLLAHHEDRMTAVVPALGFSLVTLDAYVLAAREIPAARPTCSIRWETLAGISTIESNHARFGGASVGPDGAIDSEILGPVLDGSLEGTAVIVDSDGGALDGDPVYDRAVGPFQFLPSTWRTHGLDANGDEDIDPHNLYDAALSAAGYLCATSDVASDGDIERSVLSYNHSRVYLHDVTAAARGIITGFDLPEPAFDPETIELSGDWTIELVGARSWHL